MASNVTLMKILEEGSAWYHRADPRPLDEPLLLLLPYDMGDPRPPLNPRGVRGRAGKGSCGVKS